MLSFDAYQLATLPYSWLQALYVTLGALTGLIGIHWWLTSMLGRRQHEARGAA